MRLSAGSAAFADRIIGECDLDSLSIFQCDRDPEHSRLTYFHHIGVPDDAQFAYRDGLVFEHDPFTNLLHHGAATQAGFVPWQDRQLAPQIGRAQTYRDFIFSYSVDVVGAHVERIAPGRYLLIGVHRRPTPRSRLAVDFAKLAGQTGLLAHMVVTQLLAETLSRSQGRRAFEEVLGYPGSSGGSAVLSNREAEIAELVCAGKLNKQIASETGLSEYTVENYLRRIYKKFNVHNRTALVSAMLGPLH